MVGLDWTIEEAVKVQMSGRVLMPDTVRLGGPGVASRPQSVGHLIVAQAHMVPKLVDYRVLDLGHDLVHRVAGPEYRPTINLNPVRKAGMTNASICEGDALVEAEQLIVVGPDAEFLQVLRIRLLSDDDRDVFEHVPEFIG